MSPAVRWTGLLFVGAGLALASFKVIRHELPLAPSEEQGPWQVELTVTVRGDGQRGSVRAMLPANEPGQRIFDERASSDRLDWEVLERESGRTGLWSGWLEGVHEVVYRFRVQSRAVDLPLRASAQPEAPGRTLRSLYLKPSATIPSTAPALRTQVEDLSLPPPADPAARTQMVFSFVTHEISTEHSAAGDALLTLDRREGSPAGKERLLVAQRGAAPQEHLRARFDLDRGALLFVDTRRFGTFDWYRARGDSAPAGIDPLSPELTPPRLEGLLRGSTQNLKAWLLRQDRLVGLGNIYASEILHDARVSPLRDTRSLIDDEIGRLYRSTRKILRRAIRNCGTTFSDFQDARGVEGSYQQYLAVYDRAGLGCPRCRTPIDRVVQQQRSTFHCPGCQD